MIQRNLATQTTRPAFEEGFAARVNAADAETTQRLAVEAAKASVVKMPGAVAKLFGRAEGAEVPAKQAQGPVEQHQDKFKAGSDAPGKVDILYLGVEGPPAVFVLFDTKSGVEHRIPIEAGTHITYDNAVYEHRVDAHPDSKRTMLGPASLPSGGRRLEPVGGGYYYDDDDDDDWTPRPTLSPKPSFSPTFKPTLRPTVSPMPTAGPTSRPTYAPTPSPTSTPTATPAPTASPLVADNDSIREAVALWFSDRAAAIRMYGHISTWETGAVTDMSKLFCASYFTTCNTAAGSLVP